MKGTVYFVLEILKAFWPFVNDKGRCLRFKEKLSFLQIIGMLFHRSETFLHVISVTDLGSGTAGKQDSVANMMELAWVATHLDDDVISVGTESAWSDISGKIQWRI